MKWVYQLGFGFLITIPVFAQTQEPKETSLPDFIMEGGAQGGVTLYTRRDSWDPEHMKNKVRDAFLTACRDHRDISAYSIDSGTNMVEIRFRATGFLTEKTVRQFATMMTNRFWREAKVGWTFMERMDGTMKWTSGGPPVGEVFSKEVNGELVPVFSWEVPDAFGESPEGEAETDRGEDLPER